MRDFEDFTGDTKKRWEERLERHRHGHVWAGIFLLAIGGLALIRSFGVPMPVWLFSWQMLLIAIGLFIGFRKGFRDGGWFIPIIIGGAFLANDFFLQGELRRHIWPLILIVVGVLFIFRPRGRHRHNYLDQKKNTGLSTEVITPVSEQSYSQDDFIDTTSIFGGTEKTILSKNFKGGNMVNIFGGTELNLTQADINGTAVLEVTAIFGGATLIVPSHWVIKSEAVTIFGGISEKRRNMTGFTETPGKTLIIKGTVMFGGIEIKSF
jgi:predicted membrane protein